MQEEFEDKWVLTTNGSATRYADTDATVTLTVTVTTKFNGTLTDADSTPSGWTKSSTGTYTKSLTAATGSIGAAAFSLTPDASSKYKNCTTVSKNSTAKSITVVNPIYYGFSTATTATQT